MKIFISKLFTLALLLFFASTAFGQGSMGQIGGKVTDGKDPVVGAGVRLTNTSTGFKASTVSDIDGRYLLVELPLGGPYEIEVSYVGK